MFGAWRVRCISEWKWVCFIRPVQNGIWTDGSRPKTEKDFTNRDISMQDAQKTYLRWSLKKLGFFLKNGVFILFLVMLVISGCSKRTPSLRNHYGIQDQHPETWIESNRRIEHFVNIYRKNTHVRICLERAEKKGYLHYIHRVFTNIDCLRNWHTFQF